jgi:plasmid stabilization system protein ParE
VTLPVVWIPEANEDLQEARAWYDNIRPELGERFARAVEVTVEAIAEHPLQFPVVYRSRRRARVRRFPYGIFFRSIGLWQSPASTAGAIRGAGSRGKRSALLARIRAPEPLLHRLRPGPPAHRYTLELFSLAASGGSQPLWYRLLLTTYMSFSSVIVLSGL